MIKIINEKLDKKSLAIAIDVLTEAFRNDPLYNVIFGNKRELYLYLKLIIGYYNKNGEIHTAIIDNQIVAVSIWNSKGTQYPTICDLLIKGMLLEGIVFFIKTRFKSIKKLNYEVLITERYHYNKEHNYLLTLGSVRKGAGYALMEYAIRKFNDYPIYLENSNIKNNKNFYKRLGFHSIKTIHVMGIPVDLLVNDYENVEA
jgi:hypothetical protein